MRGSPRSVSVWGWLAVAAVAAIAGTACSSPADATGQTATGGGGGSGGGGATDTGGSAGSTGGSDSGETGGSGGAATTGGTGGTAAMALADHQEFIGRRAHTVCSTLIRCVFPDDDVLGPRIVLGTVERCEEYLESAWRYYSSLGDLERMIGSGSIQFVPAQAEQCLVDLGECASFLEEPRSCRLAYEGTVAEGGPCYRHEECAGDGYCFSGDWTCPGTCQPRKPPGSTCEDDEECDDALGLAECDWSEDLPVCVTRTLEFGAGLGESCGRQGADIEVMCEDGLWCDTGTQQPGTCLAPIAVGQSCEGYDDVCEDGALCLPEEGAGYSCQPFTVAATPGTPCDESGFESGTLCDPLSNLQCAGGTCQVVGDGTLGSSCLAGDMAEVSSCRAGLGCVQDSSTGEATCQALKTAGEPCVSSRECEVDCDWQAGVCTDRYCGL